MGHQLAPFESVGGSAVSMVISGLISMVGHRRSEWSGGADNCD
jgi:hypothetical protein